MLVERFFPTCQPPVSVAPFPWQAPQHHVAEAPQTCTLGPWAPVLELLPFFAWLKETSGIGKRLDRMGTSVYSWRPMLAVAIASSSVMSRLPPLLNTVNASNMILEDKTNQPPPGEDSEEPRQSQVNQARAAFTLCPQGLL